MININLYKAKVIDTADTDSKAKIKVRLLPEMKDISEDHLPWVRSFFTLGMSATNYSFHLPKIDSYVWVFFLDEYFQEGFWFTGIFMDGFF